MLVYYLVLGEPGIGRARYRESQVSLAVVVDQTFIPWGVWTHAHSYSLILAASGFSHAKFSWLVSTMRLF